MTTQIPASQAESSDARNVVAEVVRELGAAEVVYATVHQQIHRDQRLEGPTRESAIRVISQVATTLRRIAPSLSATQDLPADDRPEIQLVVLRLLTDSLSVALGDRPAFDLMVAPDDIDALLRAVGS